MIGGRSELEAIQAQMPKRRYSLSNGSAADIPACATREGDRVPAARRTVCIVHAARARGDVEHRGGRHRPQRDLDRQLLPAAPRVGTRHRAAGIVRAHRRLGGRLQDLVRGKQRHVDAPRGPERPDRHRDDEQRAVMDRNRRRIRGRTDRRRSRIQHHRGVRDPRRIEHQRLLVLRRRGMERPDRCHCAGGIVRLRCKPRGRRSGPDGAVRWSRVVGRRHQLERHSEHHMDRDPRHGRRRREHDLGVCRRQPLARDDGRRHELDTGHGALWQRAGHRRRIRNGGIHPVPHMVVGNLRVDQWWHELDPANGSRGRPCGTALVGRRCPSGNPVDGLGRWHQRHDPQDHRHRCNVDEPVDADEPDAARRVRPNDERRVGRR